MSLTPAQLATLKAAILAETDPTFVAYRDTGNNGGMLLWFNEAASPAFTVWRTAVTRREVTAEGFDYTQVDNLTNGQARIWDWLFDSGSMNPADPGVRAGIAETWKGTAAKVAVQTFVLTKCKRSALRVEKLFATGAGSDATPATMTYEGNLSIDDIRAAVAL